ncbi:MAG TPA: enoyl-CoA hydratase-related protein [Acidimicrobiia bacterium]|jgi:2-(1,2-epoxy-1,2-dihydrophenyl)acetyl-CoA isomerase
MSVTYSLDGDVAVITLDRPDVFNSIDQPISDGVISGIERAGKEARAAVVTGAGKAFCAGADLGDLRREYALAGGPDLHSVITRRFNPLVGAILDSSVPTVAAVNGAAAGAGMGLALACDVRVMSSRAFFMSAFINVGLIPDSGSSWFLPAMVGVSRAMEIAMSGRRVDAAESEQLGLAMRICAPDALLADAVSIARAFADGPTVAYQATRRILHAAAASTLQATLEAEARVQGELGGLPSHEEGMAAFSEKRPPDFRTSG